MCIIVVFDMSKFSIIVSLRGHKENKHVSSFSLLCPPRLTIILNFNISKVAISVGVIVKNLGGIGKKWLS